MQYAQIREMDISNGEGVGAALFVQGCHFRCKGCFNQETWDFDGGKPWTNKTLAKFLQIVDKPYIKRISILGGEPLANENVAEVVSLIATLRQRFPDKKIWLYTGYTLDEILSPQNCTADSFLYDIRRKEAIDNVDYLLEGRFDMTKQDINHKQKRWVGSLNQRVIPASTIKMAERLSAGKRRL